MDQQSTVSDGRGVSAHLTAYWGNLKPASHPPMQSVLMASAQIMAAATGLVEGLVFLTIRDVQLAVEWSANA
jgi:hypothetical protein